jgi:outer membrane protein assembly factor BamB
MNRMTLIRDNIKGAAMKRWIALWVAMVFTSPLTGAENRLAWPQFRGPGGSGVAESQNPPVEIGPEKNVKWKVPAPSGLSSPIVVGDLLVLTAFEDGKLYTVAYRRQDGKEAWRADAQAKQIEKFHKTEGSPAASTPATDGERIVSYFGSCGLVCYDKSGKELWKFEMPPAGSGGDFGSGVSPIIAEGLVVLVRDQLKDAKIYAIDLANGALRWDKSRPSPASYSTPTVWDTSEGKQIAMAGHARLIGYDLKTGAEKWSVAGIPASCCSSPVTSDGTLYFAGAGPGGEPGEKESQMPTFDGLLKDLDKDKDGALSKAEGEKAFEGFFDNQDMNKDGQITRTEWDALMKFFSEGKSAAFALKAGGTGDVTSTHILWNKTKGLPSVASAIVYGGQYVMVKDGGIVTAYDAKTGDEVFQKRVAAAGTYYASPVAAGGHIYFASLADGTVAVLKAGTKDPEVVAQNPPLGERIAATPAIADDTLYIRTAGHLYAFAAK